MDNKCDSLVSFSAGYSNKSESSKLKANSSVSKGKYSKSLRFCDSADVTHLGLAVWKSKTLQVLLHHAY